MKGLDGKIHLIDWEYSGMNDHMGFGCLLLKVLFRRESAEGFIIVL